MTALTLYSNPMSRGRIARWMLEEVGQPYSVNYVQFGPEMRGAEYAAINPMKKVPALKHGEQIITECGAICAYLADAFPEANLKAKKEELGAYYRWLFFAAGPVESAVANKTMGFDPDEKQSQTVGYGNFERVYDLLVHAVSQHSFVCGESFTAADVYFGSEIAWGLQFGTMPEHPALNAYRDRICARPAHLRANELDDKAMAEMK